MPTRDIEKERQALATVTKDKAFLNKAGIKAGTDLTTLKTTNPAAYDSLFKEVNRRAYEIPAAPTAAPVAPSMNPEQQTTFDQAQARVTALKGAVDKQYPAAKTYTDLEANLPKLREQAGLSQAQKNYADVLKTYMTAPGDIRQKLIKEKGYNIQGAQDNLSNTEAELATARTRFLEGSLSGTEYAGLVSRYHNAARNYKKMADDLTTETDRGVDFYKSLLTLSQNQVTQAQGAYDDLLGLEKAGVAEDSAAKREMATTLSNAYSDVEEAARWAKEFALKQKKASNTSSNNSSSKLTNYDQLKAELENSKDKGPNSDGHANTDTYKRLRDGLKTGVDKTEFDKNFNYMLNPSDPTASQYLAKGVDMEQDISDARSYLFGKKDTQGFVSADDYNVGRNAWIDAGLKPEDFDKRFNIYIDPAKGKNYQGYKAPAKSSTRTPLFGPSK